MSASHLADERYYAIRDSVKTAQINGANIVEANLAYANVRTLITRARYNEECIPDLQTSIMELPMNLMQAFGITTEHESLWEAVMNLPNQLIEILEPLFNFEAKMATLK